MLNKIYNLIKSLFVTDKPSVTINEPVIEPVIESVAEPVIEPTVELVKEPIIPIVEEVVVKPKSKHKKPYRPKSKKTAKVN